MHGRAFLELARELLAGGQERHNRGAVGRAYYALMLECRDGLYRWGFKLPPRENVHTFVRLHFTFPANPDLKTIGQALEILGRLRNRADYDLSVQSAFVTVNTAQMAVTQSSGSLNLLDAIEADPARRNAAVTAIRKAFP
jgi:hypothetical protein